MVYTDALHRLAGKGLTAAIVVANFHRWRVLPLMKRKLPLFQITEDASSEGTRTMAELLSYDVATQRVGRAVSQPPGGLGDLWGVPMRPDEGYIQLVSFASRHRLFASSLFS